MVKENKKKPRKQFLYEYFQKGKGPDQVETKMVN
jgi:hypothetical protein